MSPLLLHSNTNQYNIHCLLCTYTKMFRIQTCCNHIKWAAEGFRGQEATCADPGILSVLLSPQLILQFTEGSNGFIAEKTILILYQGSRGGPLISRGGGCPTFSRGGGGGPNAYFYRNPIRTCYFPSGCPLSPSGSAHGQCHHNGTIIITVQLLTLIVGHWFVRIYDRWGFPNDALVLRMFDTFEKHSSWKW